MLFSNSTRPLPMNRISKSQQILKNPILIAADFWRSFRGISKSLTSNFFLGIFRNFAKSRFKILQILSVIKKIPAKNNGKKLLPENNNSRSEHLRETGASQGDPLAAGLFWKRCRPFPSPGRSRSCWSQAHHTRKPFLEAICHWRTRSSACPCCRSLGKRRI